MSFGLDRMSTAVRLPTLLVIVASLVACGGNSSVTPSDIPRLTPPIVVALGDSLTAGPGLAAEETYPALLQRRIRDAGYPHRVVNAGVSGDTSTGALSRLDAALVPDTRVLIVALGANDGLRHVPVDTIRSNLETMIERAQARGIRILLCGMETPPTHGLQYTLEFHHLFPDLATRYGVPMMPFLLTGVAGNPDYNLPDRVHPNAAGMRIIAQNMWPHLEPLLR
jgi:acyl-CoA thioesterase-1